MFVLVAAAGLLVIGLAPPTCAEDQLDEVLDDDDLDVEDELDLGLGDDEETGDVSEEEEAAKAPPPAPKVSGGGACFDNSRGCLLLTLV